MELQNNPAWNLLTKDEQTALVFTNNFGKSTWEAGEMMKKSHYKFLEIKTRAQMLFETFNAHFEKYDGELFPESLELPMSFKLYLQLTILSRKKPNEAVKIMDIPSWKRRNSKESAILEVMEELSKSKSEDKQDLWRLILDYDRINKFRILPLSIQEKSIYKRRNKTRYRKYLTLYTRLPHFSVMMLIDKYHSNNDKVEKYFLPVISKELPNHYSIIEVKKTEREKGRHFDEVKSLGLFIYDNAREAIKFAELLSTYFYVLEKNPKTGQQFWPKARTLMEAAINFNEIDHIAMGREGLPEIFLSIKKANRNLKDIPRKNKKKKRVVKKLQIKK